MEEMYYFNWEKEVLEKAPTFNEVLAMFWVKETLEMAKLKWEIVDLFRKWATSEDYIGKYLELEKLLKNWFGENEYAIWLYQASIYLEWWKIDKYKEEIEWGGGLIVYMWYDWEVDKKIYDAVKEWHKANLSKVKS